jgi:diguanylate cyclase (GGDEF)-like protein
VSKTRVRAALNLRARRVAMSILIVLAAVLALLWLIGRTVDQSRTTASNAQLTADLQVARATFQGDVAAAARKAVALAHMPRVEAALSSGDTAALQALASAHPDTLLISKRGERRGSLAPLGVRRIVEVVSGGLTLGRVVADAPLDSPFLSRVQANLPTGTHDILVVTDGDRIATGPLPAGLMLATASARDVSIQGRTYRALGLPLVSDRPELRIVALAPGPASFGTAWRLPLAVLATFVALGILLIVTPVVLRGPNRARRVPRVAEVPIVEPSEQQQAVSVELLGERLAAASDVEALLRVILDAAIKATGAEGGRVARPGEPISRGVESGNEMLRVPLETNELEGNSSLLLYPPPSGFSADAAEVARWLGAHANTAIMDARFHRVAEEPGVNDELTGLANRSHFTTTLQREFARAERSAAPLSVLLSDIDDFKGVSGRLGPRGGEELLRAYAAALRRCSREVDIAVRFGAERFGLLLPQMDTAGARDVAERLGAEFLAEQGLPEPVTASFGISSYPQATSTEELLRTADACLRRAKESGKGQIVVADGSTPPSAKT